MGIKDERHIAYTAHEVTGIKFVESDEEYPDLDEYFLAVYSTEEKAKLVVQELIRDGYDLYDMSPIDILD